MAHRGEEDPAAAVDFLASLSETADLGRREALADVFSQLHARGQRLFVRLWSGLKQISGVTVYGPPPEAARTPTVSFVVAGRGADQVAEELARRAVFVSSGDFYAWTVMKRLGHEKDGVVRAGCACYTTDDEVDRLVEGVREIASK